MSVPFHTVNHFWYDIINYNDLNNVSRFFKEVAQLYTNNKRLCLMTEKLIMTPLVFARDTKGLRHFSTTLLREMTFNCCYTGQLVKINCISWSNSCYFVRALQIQPIEDKTVSNKTIRTGFQKIDCPLYNIRISHSHPLPPSLIK